MNTDADDGKTAERLAGEPAPVTDPTARDQAALPVAAGQRPDIAEPVSPITLPDPDYTESGVPSLDFVRDKIEGRYARSLGSTELAEQTSEARSFAEQAAEREEAAAKRLEAIRRSLRDRPST